jgi:hypothetical protein
MEKIKRGEDKGRREAAKQPTLLPCVAVGFWFSLW